jgi:hypothetical protein
MKLAPDGLELRQTLRRRLLPPERGIARLTVELEFARNLFHRAILSGKPAETARLTRYGSAKTYGACPRFGG